MQLLNYTNKLLYLLVQATTSSINKGVFVNGKQGPTQSAMFVDDNLIADIWEQLKPVLACIIESLCTLLGEPDLQLRWSLLSMDKNFNAA